MRARGGSGKWMVLFFIKSYSVTFYEARHTAVRSFFIRTIEGHRFDFKGGSLQSFHRGGIILDILERRSLLSSDPGCRTLPLYQKSNFSSLDIILLLVFGAGGCTHLFQGPGLLLIVAEGCSSQHFFHAAEGAALFVGLGFINETGSVCICSLILIRGDGFYIHSNRLVGTCKAACLVCLPGIDFCAILFVGAFQLVGKIDISGILNKPIACTGIDGDGLPR